MVKKEFVTLPLNEIIPYEKNPRINDDAVVDTMESIKQCENLDPIEIDEKNVILSGHTRLKALKKLGFDSTECVRYIGLSKEKKKKYRILANKVAEKSQWDIDLLTEELEGLDFEGFDFGFDDLDAVLGEEDPVEVREDEAPEPPEEPKAKLGDLWLLGNSHRLICGDSTDIAVIDRLMDGVKAKLLLTDPPYNMEMGGHGKTSELGKRGEKLRNSIEHIADFDAKDIEYIFSIFDNISIYIFTSKNLVGDYLNFAKGWNFNILVWNKTNPAPLVNNTFLSDLEYIMFFYRGERVWNNGLKPFDIYSKCYTSSITEGSKDAGKIHPTMKPISMLSNFIRLSSNENDIVLDIFGGSGSTLIACEQLNRKCYMCELDERYASVIVNRWLNFTGRKDEIFCIRDGKKLTYDEVFN